MFGKLGRYFVYEGSNLSDSSRIDGHTASIKSRIHVHVHKAQADKKIHFSDKTYFGASFHMFAVVQLYPGVPAMAVQRQAVPLVQQYRLFGPNYSNTRTTIEPEKERKNTAVTNRFEKSGEREIWGYQSSAPEDSGFLSKKSKVT